MLKLQELREHKNQILERLSKRNKDFTPTIEQIILLDEKKRKLQSNLDQNLFEANKLSKEIGSFMKEGKKEEASELKNKNTQLKEDAKNIEHELLDIEQELQKLLYEIPNAPHESVPKGKNAEDNSIIFQEGTIPALSSPHNLPHWEITEKYRLINFDLGSKITGAGFPVYMGKGARLQRALISFFLDEAIKAGYEEVIPPHVVNKESGFGTGQLPDKDGQMYYIQEDDLYLIPTAEVPITNLYRDVMVTPQQLPIKNVGYTPCFRREAGSYGKDVRGLNRLHQFDKVEIVQISHPSSSYQVLEEMLEHVKNLLRKLELPYRVAFLCGGDMSFSSAKTYDMEVYSAAQQRWLEVSSISNFETFQSNRLKLRMKEDGKSVHVHTLNGSALALPRIVAALLENHQTEKGIKIPKALVPYTGFEYIV